MKKHLTKIVVFYLLALAFFTLPKHISAVERTNRLYIPVSNSLTIEKEGDDKKLLTKDYLSSTRSVDGSTQESQKYYPYGDSPERESLKGTNKQFTGHRLLNDTGIYHAGARFYNPQLGAFISADKAEGPNRYAYAKNNPIFYLDESGQSSHNYNVIFEPSSAAIFPEALPLVDSNYTQRFADSRLKGLAYFYTQRNPFDPQTQRQEFVQYLISDIYKTVSYAPGIVGPQRSYNRKMSNLKVQYKSVSELDPHTLGDNVTQGRSQKAAAKTKILLQMNSLGATKYFVDKQVKEATDHYNTLNLADRIAQGNATCYDFCDFTGYTLAQVGIPTAIGGTSEFTHAFGLVQIGDTPHMFDTTWNYMATFYEDRMGFNKHNPYNSFGFQSPWGNAFGINLHQEKLPRNAANPDKSKDKARKPYVWTQSKSVESY